MKKIDLIWTVLLMNILFSGATLTGCFGKSAREKSSSPIGREAPSDGTVSNPVQEGDPGVQRVNSTDDYSSLSDIDKKVPILLEVKKKIPTLFSESAFWDINLFSILDDETQLLHTLEADPSYKSELEKKKLFDIRIKPLEGFSIAASSIDGDETDVGMKEADSADWKAHLKDLANQLLSEVQPDQPIAATLGHSIHNEMARLSQPEILQKISDKKGFGQIIGTLTNIKPNQAVLGQAMRKAKDTFEKLQVIASKYDELPEKPPGLIEKVHEALGILGSLRTFNQMVELLSCLSLNHAEEISVLKYSEINQLIAELSSEDLLNLQDRNGVIAPLVRSAIPGADGVLVEQTISEFKKSIDAYSSGIRAHSIRTNEEIELEQLAPSVAIFRGILGNDCATSRSFPYPNDPNEAVFVIRDSHGNSKGYITATFLNADHHPALYVLTVAGNRINQADTEMVLRGLEKEKASLGVSEIVLPVKRNLPGLVNYDQPRAVYQKHIRNKEEQVLTYQNPEIRSKIEGYKGSHGYNVGTYDYMAQNTHGVMLQLKPYELAQIGTTLSIRDMDELHPVKWEEVHKEDIVTFLMDLKESKRKQLFDQLLKNHWIKDKIKAQELHDLSDTLSNCKRSPHSGEMSLSEYESFVKQEFLEVGLPRDFYDHHTQLLYPGTIHCRDAFDPVNAELSATEIVTDFKKAEGRKDAGIFDLFEKSDVTEELFKTIASSLIKTKTFKAYIDGLKSSLQSTDAYRKNAAAKHLKRLEPYLEGLENEPAGPAPASVGQGKKVAGKS